MIRRFIRLNMFEVVGDRFKEKERLILSSKIYSVSKHYTYNDALILWDEQGSSIGNVQMSMDELIKIMQNPIEIPI